ncbi:MAG TPA: MlaD family protein [Polyangiaceae bacterium]|jgi:phospholipid/cholesterol/gamma-HCH transport system substrate-binding protein
MGEWTKAAKVGLFVIVIALASVFLYRAISRTAGTSGGYTVYASFKDAIGLAPQSRVVMAGIPVGTIKSIRLDHDMARIDIMMMPEVQLHDDASVAKRSAGILGEYFLALTPGTDGRPDLHNGDRISNVLEAASTDQLIADLARIADRVKLVAENLATTLGSPEGREDMRKTLENLAGVTEALNQTVRDNREAIRHILINVEGITDNASPELKQILENVRVVTSDVRDLLAENKSGAKGSGDLRETVERVNRASASLESALSHIDSVSGRIDRGEGTVGRLTKDETLINEVQGAVEGVSDFVGGISRLQTIVGLRADYNFVSNTIKSYVELRLQPAEDKYYLIEIINDPRGKTTFEQVDVDTTDPTRPQHYRDVRTTTTNAFRFSIMFAKRIGPFTGRFGILESTGGIGLDTHLLRDRFEIRQDLFGFGEELQPRWRIALAYEFVNRLWMLAGVDEILNNDRRDYFVGLQLRFNDEDLKAMLPFASIKP